MLLFVVSFSNPKHIHHSEINASCNSPPWYARQITAPHRVAFWITFNKIKHKIVPTRDPPATAHCPLFLSGLHWAICRVPSQHPFTAVLCTPLPTSSALMWFCPFLRNTSSAQMFFKQLCESSICRWVMWGHLVHSEGIFNQAITIFRQQIHANWGICNPGGRNCSPDCSVKVQSLTNEKLSVSNCSNCHWCNYSDCYKRWKR